MGSWLAARRIGAIANTSGDTRQGQAVSHLFGVFQCLRVFQAIALGAGAARTATRVNGAG
ncbi:hypothetical protein Aple_080170 [Acrocarpospora pleiomorpha]|uniref:Uncharacterized protein n=1 Tax=Acrocarpospora pleiomorpha TaxID=90975 RepID=A0A5M3Y2T1_9ACTN|nr:hypothetical protein Aple_080170 [Acrocarpospora pleiomorpha]